MRHERGQTGALLLYEPKHSGRNRCMDDPGIWHKPTGKKDSPFMPFLEQYPERPLCHHSEYTDNLHDHLDVPLSCCFPTWFIWTLSDMSVWSLGVGRVLQGWVKFKLCFSNGLDLTLTQETYFVFAHDLGKGLNPSGSLSTWLTAVSPIMERAWLTPKPCPNALGLKKAHDFLQLLSEERRFSVHVKKHNHSF